LDESGSSARLQVKPCFHLEAKGDFDYFLVDKFETDINKTYPNSVFKSASDNVAEREPKEESLRKFLK
jgi:hypothetical protein